MSVDLQVRAVEPGDIEAVLANLRSADLAECEALFGSDTMPGVLRDSVRVSIKVWTATFDGEVGCIFGVAPISLLGGDGIPWLIGTSLIDRHRGVFIRASRRYIAQMLDAFPVLGNVVDARNVKSIAWLKKMGFTLLEPIVIGVAGLPFYPFAMGSHPAVTGNTW